MGELQGTKSTVRPLTPEQLYRACDLSRLAFGSTAELEPIDGMIGQARALPNLVHRITLFPVADYEQMKQRFPNKEVSPQRGAPYGMKRELLVLPLGLPCNPPPWGVLTAMDLGSRKILWQTPLGTIEELNPLGVARRLGTPTFGGPLATASGLIFIGATLDDYLRAFDAKTSAELWAGRLPAAGIATPTTYL
jgi:quinoprotein glucose dehydrogenase